MNNSRRLNEEKGISNMKKIEGQSEMVYLNPNVSVITLNLNRLHSPIKRWDNYELHNIKIWLYTI